MAAVTDFANDPLAGRVYLVLFGPYKVGKTRTALRLVAEHRDVVYLFSYDRGDFWVRQNPDLFKGRFVRYTPTTLKELRADLKDCQVRVKKLLEKFPASRVWVVHDTVTHVQTHLLAEARRVAVAKGQGGRGELAQISDEYVREMVTQVDYQVNLGHMSELADALTALPCNVVAICNEKQESRGREKTGVLIPALSGGAYTRILGDADAVLRMTREGGDAKLTTFGGDGSDVGDRSGNLDREEPCDLKHIQCKMLGLPEEPEGTDGAGASESEKTEAGVA